MPSVKSWQMVLGVAGTFIILTDVLYYVYLKMTAPPKKKKSKSKKKKTKNNPKPKGEETMVEVIPEEVETEEYPYQAHRNPWFRYLPRTDFREGVSEEDLWNTALFFPEINPEQEFSQTRQFMWYMEQAKISLKVAIYTSSYKLLENVLVDQVKNKVQVMVVSNVPKVLRLRSRGVQVREKPKLVPSPHDDGKRLFLDHMHNKFIIIDDKAIMTGSLNWTISAVMENRENILVTNDMDIVDLYVKEFQQLWEMSDPKKPKIMAKAPPLTEKQRRNSHSITKCRKSY